MELDAFLNSFLNYCESGTDNVLNYCEFIVKGYWTFTIIIVKFIPIP